MGIKTQRVIQMQAGGGDCNDTNNLVNPGRMENCGNLIDNNCNGLLLIESRFVVQDVQIWMVMATNATCNGDRNNRGGDCNDGPNVNPGAMERCGNQQMIAWAETYLVYPIVPIWIMMALG